MFFVIPHCFFNMAKKQNSSYQNRFPPKAGSKCSHSQQYKSIIKELDFPMYKTTFWTYSTFVRLFGLFGFNIWTYSTLKSDSHLPKKNLFISMMALQKWWKMFLLHFKSSFHSQDTKFYVLTFRPFGKNSLIRKIRLISKFIMSQPG